MSTNLPHGTRVLRLVGTLALAALTGPICAAPVTAGGDPVVELAGSHVVAVHAGGQSLTRRELLTGRSSGAVSFENEQGFPTVAADDLDLATYFARGSVADPEWRIDLGAWHDTNGAAPDFFVFEVGGNDAIDVAPVLEDGTVGQPVPLSGWTSTGYAPNAGPNAGQTVHGLVFSIADLRDETGAPLDESRTLSAISVLAPSLDGALFAAVHPDPPPIGTDGDGSLLLTPAVPTVWQPMEIALRGPWASELGIVRNPFLDYRMTVTFTGPHGLSYEVPGFFAGDGRGAGEGNVWKARFAPDRPGEWGAVVSFRAGADAAIDLDPAAGTPVAPFDAVGMRFAVAPRDPAARGFEKWGRLDYVRAHYRKFQDGPWFLKGGTNSPENLLAYWGFDGARDLGNLGVLHRYEAHRRDWREGDPLFESDCTGYDSKGIVGALNYLGEQGVNSVYFLPMNMGGDGQDTAPFVGYENAPFDKTHYDVSRLLQWNLVLEHAQRQGISVQLVLSETEVSNEQWLDAGLLGRERKLFFRELVARFGHILAVKWNLAEENDFSVEELRDFADYLRALDAYDHPIGFHNHPDDFTDYDAVVGEERFEAVSLQYTPDLAGAHAEAIRAASAEAGRAWLAELDENMPWNVGLTDSNAAELRKNILWDVYLSGGQLEWYFGFHGLPMGGDLTVEDFTTRAEMWAYMRHARKLVEGLPFWAMEPADHLVSGASPAWGGPEVFAQHRAVYAVYLPEASGAGSLDLTGVRGTYVQRWFDPRAGRWTGGPRLVAGGAPVPIGLPPAAADEDWVVVFTRDDLGQREPAGQ